MEIVLQCIKKICKFTVAYIVIFYMLNLIWVREADIFPQIIIAVVGYSILESYYAIKKDKY